MGLPAILHIWDHLTSDGWQPRARGIQARLLIGGAEVALRAEQAAVLGIERLDGDVARALRGLLTTYCGRVWGSAQRLGLVDLGPNGDTLANLARALGDAPGRELTHYLFHTKASAVEHLLHGRRVLSFFGFSPEAERIAGLMNRSHEVIEVLLTAGCGSTLGYRRTGAGPNAMDPVEPVLAPRMDTPEQAQWIASGRCGIVAAWHHVAQAVRHVTLARA